MIIASHAFVTSTRSDKRGGARKAKKNLSSADTLAHGIGTPDDIWLLFAALASAEGYDVRWL